MERGQLPCPRVWLPDGKLESNGGEPPGPGQNSAGLALYRYDTSCGTVLGHAGNFPGYTQFIGATPNGRHQGH